MNKVIVLVVVCFVLIPCVKAQEIENRIMDNYQLLSGDAGTMNDTEEIALQKSQQPTLWKGVSAKPRKKARKSVENNDAFSEGWLEKWSQLTLKPEISIGYAYGLRLKADSERNTNDWINGEGKGAKGFDIKVGVEIFPWLSVGGQYLRLSGFKDEMRFSCDDGSYAYSYWKFNQTAKMAYLKPKIPVEVGKGVEVVLHGLAGIGQLNTKMWSRDENAAWDYVEDYKGNANDECREIGGGVEISIQNKLVISGTLVQLKANIGSNIADKFTTDAMVFGVGYKF